MTRTLVVAAALVALVALAAPASAGTINGTITEQVGGAAVASAEVRVWSLGPKGWSILQTTTANASGGYAFTVTAASYLIDVRGPAGSGANYGDRWYDIAAPNSGGYVGENADPIAVGATSTVSGIDVALEVLGGGDGTVYRAGGVEAPSMWVRMERRAEVRIHHNDFTKAAPTGLVSMRGMVPATDYQLIVYDPAGVRDTLLVPGPFTIVSNTNGSLGNLTMADTPADPNEGNNGANCSAVSIDAAALHMDPPQPWSSTGARIAPLGDVDWFCFTAVDGDRLFVTATTEFTFAGATRRHPWTDPLLSFWRGARVTRLAENDDSLGAGYDARVDTGPLTAGCHCAAVTTFGDAGYVGAGQNSTGAFQLRVVQGNRPPVPSIKKGTLEVPAAPATFSIDEGDTLVLDLAYADADHDVPTKSFTHLDSGGGAVAGGVLTLGANNGSYTWTAPAAGAVGSPYTLRLQAGDAEFQMTKTVILVVNAVDMPPMTPVLISPIGGAVVMTGAPTLTWANAADPDGDTVTYGLELYQDDTAGVPAQSAAAVAEGGGGMTTWVPTTIAENTRVFWRVRARGGATGLSPWSEYGRFLVDSTNDEPGTPILLKPAEGEMVAMRRPGLSVLNVDDPEDDVVEFEFEIARDVNFAMIVWTSPPVTQNTLSGTTMTGTAVDLDWGGEYYARVKARDVRGGESAWSDIHRFRLKSNVPPGTPAFDQACVATTYEQDPPTAITVRNVDDAEGEVITFELAMFRFEDDPATSPPVYRASAVMDAASTVTSIPIDLSALDNGRYRYVVRAFDGTDSSPSIECELTLDVAEGGGQPGGGCCSTSADPLGVGVLALLTVGGVLGFRRRRRRHA